MERKPRSGLDGLGIDASSHRRCIVGRGFQVRGGARPIPHHAHRHAGNVLAASGVLRHRRAGGLHAAAPAAVRPTTATSRRRARPRRRPPARRRRLPAPCGTGRQNGSLGAARCSPPTTRGTPTSPRPRCTRTPANYVATIIASGGNEPAPRLRRERRVRHPVRHRRRNASRSCRSTSPPTATRATPVRTRSRSTRPSKAASDAPRARVDRDRASSTSSFARRARAATAGTASIGRDAGTCARTRCAPTGGRRPTPPGCRSSRASCATTRWRAGAINHALRFTVPQTPARLHLPRDALRVVEHRPEPPADGAALPAQGELRHLRATPGRRA